MYKRLSIVICFIFFLGLQGFAEAATPLLQMGKKTLYQRVITHPGATVVQSPENATTIIQETVNSFTVFYVYGRRDGWVQVGPLGGTPIGWIDVAKTTEWNQSLTLLFADHSMRDPLLFFKTEESLKELCAAPDMEGRLQNLQRAASIKETNVLQTSQVVATEPSTDKGSVSRFYLMPILAMNDPFEGVKFLNVATIDPGSTAAPKKSAAPTKPRMAIAFVIDTTISMKPYIDQSLDVVRSIYDKLENSQMNDDVAFGVVAFRSSPIARPGTEYESLVVSDLTTARNRTLLESNLAKVKQATDSTHTFQENSPSGVKTAIDALSWDDYTTRMIILITDAGPLKVTDPYASVKMDMPELADYAKAKGIRISAMHIKSPKGKKDHGNAEKAYRNLTKRADNLSNYLSINAKTSAEGVSAFDSASRILTDGIVSMVRMTMDGQLVTKPAGAPLPTTASSADAAKQLAAYLGYAMQLDYLGTLNETRAPSVVNSWIADMDLQKLAKGSQVPSVEVAVLLTKNQLNDLSMQLKIIIDNAERTKKTDAKDFFQGILSASTRAARDPNSPMPQGQNLAQMGVLGEFLDGLPYKSDVMLLREEDWYRMSIGQQTTFINRLKSRLARYEEYDKDRNNWESFGASNPGDWMYRVPLTMLP